MNTVVVLVFTPANVISAFAAIATKYASQEVHSFVAICRFPGQRDLDAAELNSTIRQMLGAFRGVKSVVDIRDEELATDIALGQYLYIARVQETLGAPSADEIFYTHDVVGIIYQSACLAFPKAKKTMYGDGFGWIWHREDALPPAVNSGLRSSWLSRKIATFKGGNAPQPQPWSWEYVRGLEFLPDTICAAIPIEKSDKITKNSSVAVVPQNTIIETMGKISEHLGLSTEETRLIAAIGHRRCLLLVMSNWYEAAMSTADGEIDLYMDMLAPHLDGDCVILAKAHPGCADVAWRLEALTARLKGKTELIVFPESLKRFPLELFGNLLRKCTIVAHSSVIFAARCFYDIDVRSALSYSAAERYLDREYHELARDELNFDAGFLKAFREWDGRGVIISAQPATGASKIRTIRNWYRSIRSASGSRGI